MEYEVHLPTEILDDLFNDQTIMELINDQQTTDETESTEDFDSDSSWLPDEGTV